jgi:hypothetical protein
MEEKKVIVMDEDGTIIENETEETEAEVNVKEETMMDKIVNTMKSSGKAVVAAAAFIGAVAIGGAILIGKVVTNNNDETKDDSGYDYDYLDDVTDEEDEDTNNETEEENEDE